MLTASRASEYSFEGTPVPGSVSPASVFTSALVDGLSTVAADLDGDGYVSVDDAYGYVFDRVRSSEAQQTPQRWLYGAEGSIRLARSPSGPGPRLTPAAPPVTAADAVASRPGAGLDRRYLVAGIAVLLAVVATVITMLVMQGGPGSTGSAWRLMVRNRPAPGNDPGCTLDLTNTRTHESRTIAAVFQDSTFLMQDEGNWRWTPSYSGCKVSALDGVGDVGTLPLSVGTGTATRHPSSPTAPSPSR